MRASGFGGALGLLAVVAACGRSSLDFEAPTPPRDPSCHDATLVGAPTPATTLRLADGGVASACANWRAGTVTVRAFDREGAPATTMNLAGETVRSNMAQTPDGALALVTAASVGSKLWVLRAPSVVAEFSLDDPEGAYVAVARDGTVVVRTARELLAFAAQDDDRWTQRFRVSAPTIEPLSPMGGVGAAPLFVDADSTIVTWDTALEGRALADGTLRFRIAAPPMQEFTYVTAAGPRALYATTSDGTLMLLRDP